MYFLLYLLSLHAKLEIGRPIRNLIYIIMEYIWPIRDVSTITYRLVHQVLGLVLLRSFVKPPRIRTWSVQRTIRNYYIGF
jgi:hypothetical protein